MTKTVTVEIVGNPVPPEDLNTPYQVRVVRDAKEYANLTFFYAPIDPRDLALMIGKAVLRAAGDR